MDSGPVFYPASHVCANRHLAYYHLCRNQNHNCAFRYHNLSHDFLPCFVKHVDDSHSHRMRNQRDPYHRISDASRIHHHHSNRPHETHTRPRTFVVLFEANLQQLAVAIHPGGRRFLNRYHLLVNVRLNTSYHRMDHLACKLNKAQMQKREENSDITNREEFKIRVLEIK
ncbi:hypothetical protein Hanom_Chr17g01528621 [Helianthus anomalus]